MKVSEMMQHSVLTATPDMSLSLAWRLMEDHRIRHLPVLSEGRLVGLITDRDLRGAAPAAASPPEAEVALYMGTTPVAACMTRNVVTVSPETDIILAAQHLLHGHFGCLPVMAQEKLVGILSEIDILRGFLLVEDVAANKGRVVEDAMQDLLILVTPEDLVSTAYQRMQGGIVRHLPIVDDEDKLVGVITDRDIRRAGAFGETSAMPAASDEPFGMMTVSELMTTPVVTVRPDATLAEAAEHFLTHKFGCLPVIRDDGALAGILTVADVLILYVQDLNAGRGRL